ncbi:MAG: hypothetical protein HY898_00365 [Deltaproteobacteria bacterium]|nr:hypothetical protein [Deltaproteobacteria bacterium]
MLNRKSTAWKKSRKLGDVFGGRKWPKLADKIFARCHSLKRPSKGEPTPILIEDNPSRDFFFPIRGVDALAAFEGLPNQDIQGITHLWLRRLKRADYESGSAPYAEFICGSGVRVVVLYPWPKDMMLRFGPDKPRRSVLRRYGPWCQDLVFEDGVWALRWNLDALRRFYVEHLLFHEVGHHVDSFRRRFTEANKTRVEEFADQYAIAWSAAGVLELRASAEPEPQTLTRRSRAPRSSPRA